MGMRAVGSESPLPGRISGRRTLKRTARNYATDLFSVTHLSPDSSLGLFFCPTANTAIRPRRTISLHPLRGINFRQLAGRGIPPHPTKTSPPDHYDLRGACQEEARKDILMELGMLQHPLRHTLSPQTGRNKLKIRLHYGPATGCYLPGIQWSHSGGLLRV